MRNYCINLLCDCEIQNGEFKIFSFWLEFDLYLFVWFFKKTTSVLAMSAKQQEASNTSTDTNSEIGNNQTSSTESETLLTKVARKFGDYTREWNASTIVCLGYTSVFGLNSSASFFETIFSF